MNHQLAVTYRENPFSLDKEITASCKICGASNVRTITIRDIVDSPIQMDKYVSTVEASLIDSFDRIMCSVG